MSSGKWRLGLIVLLLMALISPATASCITLNVPEEPAVSSVLLTYTDDVNGFSVSYPQEWSGMPEELWKGLEGVVAGFWASEAGYDLAPNFKISKKSLSSEMGVQAYFESVKQQVEALGGYAFISMDNLAIEGIPAVKYVYQSSGVVTSTTMQVILVQDKTAWTVTLMCAPDVFSSLEPAFDTIATSFRLIDAAVSQEAGPVINFFTASPETISSGQSVTLDWDVSNATKVTIGPVVGNVDLTGSAQVSPTSATTYTLTAVNEGGSRKVSITVTVTSAITGRPDLVIMDIWLIGTVVHYKIKNQGDATAKPSRTYLYVNGPKVASDYVEAVAAGQEKTEIFSNYNYARPAADTVTVRACSDADNTVGESDENNNCGIANWGFLFSYDFIKNAHMATWASEAGALEWPMVADSKKGAAFLGHVVRLEDDNTHSPALATYPQQVSHGWILGRFADYYTDEYRQPRSRQIVVPEGAKFTARVGFKKTASATDGVAVALGFVDATGSVVLFRKMDVFYDGALDVYEVDLSDMAGEKTEFILWVEAKDSWEEDWLVWLDPKIAQER